MTEKRFYKVLTDCVVQDTINNELVRGSKIADVMNVLYEENEQLNEDVLRRKENEKILIKTANDLNELIDRLEKENEQLRKDREDLFYRERDTKNEWRELHIENQIFRKFIELNDFDPNEIIRQGKGIE